MNSSPKIAHVWKRDSREGFVEIFQNQKRSRGKPRPLAFPSSIESIRKSFFAPKFSLEAFLRGTSSSLSPSLSQNPQRRQVTRVTDNIADRLVKHLDLARPAKSSMTSAYRSTVHRRDQTEENIEYLLDSSDRREIRRENRE